MMDRVRIGGNGMKNISVVLVRAENPANIGQVARAMKNFGVSKLVLVNSVEHKTEQAYTLGWKAKDVLNQARTMSSLSKGIRGAALTIGFTRRSGRKRGAPRSIMQVMPQVLEIMAKKKVAFVFGNEKNGLSNEELACCHEIVAIPTSAAYSSMNLSHAVAVTLFSIFSRLPGMASPPKKAEHHYATQEEFDLLMDDFSKALILLGYQKIKRLNVFEQTLENLHHFFKRTGLEKRECHLFRALLARVCEKTAEKADEKILVKLK
ncbi:MAG: TrmJ/YjtD family RNA methyltransferase [Candidatus Omnitrophica bacterium]|nr:TrmJ/YjtD family RNA methyltransferase [Candidatus Omnitrophota bacterium]